MLTAGGSKGDTVAEQPPADGAEGGVTDVLDEDVLGVLDRNRADLVVGLCTQQRTARRPCQPKRKAAGRMDAVCCAGVQLDITAR